ncbi:MAG: M64 family metallopeptidase [Candidatus Binatia bacterium]
MLSILIVLLAMAPVGGTEASPKNAARYLVFTVQPDGSARAVFSARVLLRSPLKGRSATAARTANRESDAVGVRLEDASGAVVFEDSVEIPRWVRGEFHGAGPGPLGEFTIDGHILPDPAASFVVRVPDVAGATLALDSVRLPRGARFKLEALDEDPAVARSVPAPQPPPLPGWDNGDPANRLDLLVMGDGYSAAQQALFDSDALNLANNFFAITPYNEYRNYVNVLALFTASAQSGVDQPPYVPSCSQYARVQTCCADGDASGTTPTTVATAFNGTFCSFNIQRLVTVDTALVLAAAAAEPDWDEILVLANSPTYGGSGGAIGVISTSYAAVAVAQHEFGHTFMQLADEYSSPYPGYPACSDVMGGFPACEANVTDQTSRPLIKWTHWIDGAQPVPSFGPPPFAADAGLWQGARYLSSGMYRQGNACIMRNLGAPFCDVAAETYPLHLYASGWGIPASGIDNIEPGSESPAPGPVNLPDPGGSFSATVLGPQAGPTVTAEWFVDDVLVDTQSVATGGVTAHALVTTTGSHTVELRVTDNSPIIHPMSRASLASSRTWTVIVGSNFCGNNLVDPGEQCDDGNTADGDCCSSTCQRPTGCRTAGKSLLLLKNDSSDDSKDRLTWKWLKGAATSLAELGIPTGTTGYTLCLYSGSAAASVALPGGPAWQTAGAKGFKFTDPTGASNGAQKALLKSGASGKAKALVKGKGYYLPDALAPALALPVTAQLVNDTTSTCFEAIYVAGDVVKNDARQFKAKQ